MGIEDFSDRPSLDEMSDAEIYEAYCGELGSYLEEYGKLPYFLRKEELKQLPKTFPILRQSKVYILKYKYRKGYGEGQSEPKDTEMNIVAPTDDSADRAAHGEIFRIEVQLKDVFVDPYSVRLIQGGRELKVTF